MNVPLQEPEGLLDPDDRALWRDFLAWSQSVVTNVSRDLDDHEVSIVDLEVLGRLWERGGEMEQQDLLVWLRWSPSRLSHQLSRMTRRHLVRRKPAGAGRRMTVTITDEGEAQAMEAFSKLGSSIRRHFLAPLSDQERTALRSMVSRDSSDPANGV